jgi:Bacterial nucleoid DNA-binding protein
MPQPALVDFVSEATGFPLVATVTVMHGFMGTLIASLADLPRVVLRGFGSFGI